MSFDPEQLKRIALAKKAKLDEAIQKELNVPAEEPYTEEEVTAAVKDLENYVVAWAEEGNLSVEYPTQNPSKGFLHAVANKFKHSHPRLMVIVSEGTKTITVTWDGMNHV